MMQKNIRFTRDLSTGYAVVLILFICPVLYTCGKWDSWHETCQRNVDLHSQEYLFSLGMCP